MTVDPAQIHATLKQYFGYTSFRPLQEEIISDALGGKDVFALLPTGGGKSLCFQMPALLLPGLTVVVSPLIALMKDQVDALQASGVAATYLNSSLASGEARERYIGLNQGEYRLLYVAPERLLLSGFLEDLHRWRVNLFAIDEAHCISEWGHDFRPEYRQLSRMRGLYPNIPMMALTATATERVREDILGQLKLRDPSIYVASFNRPNLTYRIIPKSGAYDQLEDFIRSRKSESGIVYCQARKTADTLAAKLNADGIKAASYHAGLTNEERSRNQEAFLRDKVRVVCATIAFGMGINKPNVRYVVHYDLPKNVESYYQETGRAGRDGLPSECLLLYTAADRVKYSQFIDEKPDPRERELARTQLEQIVHYAETGRCRREYLLNYFGENLGTTQGEANCGACDNCISPRETWDGTVAAQKFLSCVFRVQQKSGFSVGINHIVEVLTGANTDKIRKFGHDQLSTYNIGKEHDRNEWATIGRELVRLGLLNQNAERFNALELTREGVLVLKERRPITLTRAATVSAKKKTVGEIACDELLFEKLRELRRRLADEQSVPPYIIFSDVSLRQMARFYPENDQQFSRISGVGQRKLQEYGAMFLDEIRAHLAVNPRQIFADDSFQAAPPAKNSSAITATVLETLRLHQEGNSVDEIARLRGLVPGTIFGHLTTALEAGKTLDLGRIISDKARAEIGAEFSRFGLLNLTAVAEALGTRYGSGEIRFCRSLLQNARSPQ